MDASKSLAELTGADWGPAPVTATTLIRERHDYRRMPLSTLPDAGRIRLLALGDEDVLVPLALERLRQRPEALALLCAVLAAEGFPWRESRDRVAEIRAAVGATLNDIAQTTDDFDRMQQELMVYRSLAEFERHLSAVPTT
jgi:hypothetical protein